MMNSRLVPLSELAQNLGHDLSDSMIGQNAYDHDGVKLGTVRSAIADSTSGKIRYLVISVGNWFTNKEVLVPVGLARVESDGVFLDTLTKPQVQAMQTYTEGMEITPDYQAKDEFAITGKQPTLKEGGYDYRDDDDSSTMFTAPQKLQLLEERLKVDKTRTQVGEVSIGKRVETTQATVDVSLSRDEVVIERRPVTDARPVEGNVTLGAADTAIRVNLEADQARVEKQAYVTEEVDISKRQQTETKTFTEQVGKEVLEVNRTGDVRVSGDASDAAKTTDAVKSGR
jgi:uncharacterized protein (TIGR02271 family)